MKTSPYPSGKGKVKWISTEWLAEHQNDQDLIILDIQPNVHDYIMGHLSNAIYLNEGFLRSSWNRLPSMFVPPEAIQPVFSRIGLDPNKTAVIYSGAGRYSKCTAGLGDGLEQTMMAYSLIRFGHNKVYILDGGIEKWKEEHARYNQPISGTGNRRPVATMVLYRSPRRPADRTVATRAIGRITSGITAVVGATFRDDPAQPHH